jgi:hypothetical protein
MRNLRKKEWIQMESYILFICAAEYRTACSRIRFYDDPFEKESKLINLFLSFILHLNH